MCLFLLILSKMSVHFGKSIKNRTKLRSRNSKFKDASAFTEIAELKMFTQSKFYLNKTKHFYDY